MRLVVIKKYPNEIEADIDATFLRSQGVECAVDNTFAANVMPYLQDLVTLSVMEDKEEIALEMLKNPKRFE